MSVTINSLFRRRFIVHESLDSSVVEGSAGVFNFTEAFSLTANQVHNSLLFLCVFLCNEDGCLLIILTLGIIILSSLLFIYIVCFFLILMRMVV